MTSVRKDCGQTELVAEYALQALAAGERSAFEAHLGTCEACRQELAAMRPVIDALGDWPTNVLRSPEPLWARLAKRIGADPSAETRWVGEPQWKEVGTGITCKILAKDDATQSVSLLVRLAPGAAYPPHTHAGVEELHLLDGELWIDERKLFPGDYNRAEPGTGDRRVWSETGCTCVLMTSMRDVIR